MYQNQRTWEDILKQVVWQNAIKTNVIGFDWKKCFSFGALRKLKKKRNFRPAYFFKEFLSLYVTGTVPVPFRQAFPLAFFFPFSFYFIIRANRLGGGGLPFPFLKIEKKCTDLGKNALTVRIYKLSFSFILSFSILRVSRCQISKIFSYEATLLCVARQIIIEMYWFQLFPTCMCSAKGISGIKHFFKLRQKSLVNQVQFFN